MYNNISLRSESETQHYKTYIPLQNYAQVSKIEFVFSSNICFFLCFEFRVLVVLLCLRIQENHWKNKYINYHSKVPIRSNLIYISVVDMDTLQVSTCIGTCIYVKYSYFKSGYPKVFYGVYMIYLYNYLLVYSFSVPMRQ